MSCLTSGVTGGSRWADLNRETACAVDPFTALDVCLEELAGVVGKVHQRPLVHRSDITGHGDANDEKMEKRKEKKIATYLMAYPGAVRMGYTVPCEHVLNSPI